MKLKNTVVQFSKLSAIAAFIPGVLLYYLFKVKSNQGLRMMIFILTVVYGLTMPYGEKSDFYAHKTMVSEVYFDMTFTTFFSDIINILTFELSSSSSDLYKHFISFISGAVFHSEVVFVLIVSIVYAYFFSGALALILDKLSFRNQRQKYVFVLLFLMFFINKNVEGITTVRTWTGLWVLCYSLLMYWKTKKHKYALMLLLPPLIHFAYFVIALPVYTLLVFGNRVRIVTIIFVASVALGQLKLDAVSKFFPDLSLLEQKTEQYSIDENSSALEKLESKAGKKERTFYKLLAVSGFFIYAIWVLISFVLFSKKLINSLSPMEQCFFLAGVLEISLSNVSGFNFALSNRSEIVGYTLLLIGLLSFLGRKGELFNFNKPIPMIFSLAYIGLSIPQLIYGLSFFLSKLSVFALFFPFVHAFSEDDFSVMDLIKTFV